MAFHDLNWWLPAHLIKEVICLRHPLQLMFVFLQKVHITFFWHKLQQLQGKQASILMTKLGQPIRNHFERKVLKVQYQNSLFVHKIKFKDKLWKKRYPGPFKLFECNVAPLMEYTSSTHYNNCLIKHTVKIKTTAIRGVIKPDCHYIAFQVHLENVTNIYVLLLFGDLL